MIYAVIDTNVLVSALITKNPEAATAKLEPTSLISYENCQKSRVPQGKD